MTVTSCIDCVIAINVIICRWCRSLVRSWTAIWLEIYGDIDHIISCYDHLQVMLPWTRACPHGSSVRAPGCRVTGSWAWSLMTCMLSARRRAPWQRRTGSTSSRLHSRVSSTSWSGSTLHHAVAHITSWSGSTLHHGLGQHYIKL